MKLSVTGAIALASCFAANAQNIEELFTPDLVAEQFAEPALISEHNQFGLPVLPAFWTDLVDVENVTQTGAGVYVAVLDTGLLPGSQFYLDDTRVAWNLGKGFSHDITFNPGTGQLEVGPLDDQRGYWTDLASGHGTHVASTVAGFNAFFSSGASYVPGVADEVTIIPVLVLDAWEVQTPAGVVRLSGGFDDMIAAGITYIADLAPTLDGPVVINMSLGGPGRSAEIEAAVDYAIASGVIVVASAGNSGANGMGYPGGLPQIISAGAAGWATMFDSWWTGDAPERLKKKDSNGNTSHLYLEDFSSRPVQGLGQFHNDLDVSAPGAWVVGPYKSAFQNNAGYYFLSGTSMASPHVAGIAALVLESFPDIEQAEMEFILERAAAGYSLPASDAWVSFPFSSAGGYSANWDGGDYGRGFLKADEAIRAASIHH